MLLPHQTTFQVSGGDQAEPWGGLGGVSLAGWLTRPPPRKLLTGRELGLSGRSPGPLLGAGAEGAAGGVPTGH